MTPTEQNPGRKIPRGLLWTLGAFLLLLPAAWFPPSGDMPSHVYNAALIHQVEQGLPGFTISHQWTNVASDVLLYWLVPLGGQKAAAILDMLAVALVFLGGFMFLRAYAGNVPWPCVALLVAACYGRMYWMGFNNFSLGCGCGLLALACGKSGNRRIQWLFAVLLVGTLFMHLFAFIWTAGAAIVLLLVPRLPDSIRTKVYVSLCILALAPIAYTQLRLIHGWSFAQARSVFGIDELDVFGVRSQAVYWISALIAISIVGLSYKRLRSVVATPAGFLFAMNMIFIAFIPDHIFWPSGNHATAAGLPTLTTLLFLTSRFAFFQTILLLTLLAQMDWRNWQKIAVAAVAGIHLLLCVQAALDMQWIEKKLSDAIHRLPAGSRVIADSELPGGGTWLTFHMIDLVCIEQHCYDFADYEPSAGHFRLHALPGNQYTISSHDDIERVGDFTYAITDKDPPVYFVFKCNLGFCPVQLRPGQSLRNAITSGSIVGPAH